MQEFKCESCKITSTEKHFNVEIDEERIKENEHQQKIYDEELPRFLEAKAIYKKQLDEYKIKTELYKNIVAEHNRKLFSSKWKLSYRGIEDNHGIIKGYKLEKPRLHTKGFTYLSYPMGFYSDDDYITLTTPHIMYTHYIECPVCGHKHYINYI